MNKPIVSVSQMREAENRAKKCGLDENIMIENAAAAMLRVAEKEIRKADKIAVVCGGGNNGADGMSFARMLLSYGYRVDAVSVGSHRNDFVSVRMCHFEMMGGKVYTLSDFGKRADLYDIVVDALFGVGLDRDVTGEYLEAVRIINGVHAKTISVDIPSGLGADDGRVHGDAVKADLTVTFGGFKYGHFLGRGADYCGRIVLENIGIPVTAEAVLCEESVPALPKRKQVSHKGSYGRIGVLGGSSAMVGAPLIATESALKNGAGLVTLCVASSLSAAYRARVKEATLRVLPDTDGYIMFDTTALDDLMRNADVISIGMGMGKNPHLRQIIDYIAHGFGGILIIDADGLNALKDNLDVLKGHSCKLILTPHRGEFFRIFGKCEENEIVSKTKLAAKETKAVVVNKSNVTIITDGESVYLNSAGSAALAKGGSGDALVGAVAAYAVRLGSLEGAAKACYVMGKAGEHAAAKLGENGVLASDVIEFIKQ